MKTSQQLDIIFFVKELRIEHKLSQAGLADKLDISYGLIGNIESSKFPHKYTISQLNTIMKYFDLPFEELFLKADELKLNKRKTIDLLIDKIVEYDR